MLQLKANNEGGADREQRKQKHRWNKDTSVASVPVDLSEEL